MTYESTFKNILPSTLDKNQYNLSNLTVINNRFIINALLVYNQKSPDSQITNRPIIAL